LLKEKDVSFYGQLYSYYSNQEFETLHDTLHAWGFEYVFVGGSRTTYRNESKYYHIKNNQKTT
jgi:hypothetical protein